MTLHLGQAAFLRDYTPGMITASLVILFIIFALRSFWKNGFITRLSALPMLAGGFLLQIPLVAVALSFRRMFNL